MGTGTGMGGMAVLLGRHPVCHDAAAYSRHTPLPGMSLSGGTARRWWALIVLRLLRSRPPLLSVMMSQPVSTRTVGMRLSLTRH